MHQKILAVLFSALPVVCCGCCTLPGAFRELPLPANVQTAEQLHLEAEPLHPDSAPVQPLAGTWIPYFTCAELCSGRDEAACRDAVRAYLRDLKECGIRTVFVQVCAFGEAAYPSAYYPQDPAAGGNDVMQIFTDICAELDLELHAWLNPLRLQTAGTVQAQTGDVQLCTHFRSEETRARDFVLWDGRYYLHPASAYTGEFLSGVIAELIGRYHPAGIHIDDYFYPTDSPAFDEAAFRASGAADLAAWRREKITALVRKMYKAVHEADADAVFSISPQGDLQKNYSSLYADAAGWLRDGRCADLIIPQLYYGYRNETMPFTVLLREWEALPRAEHVQLAAGLAAYKAGAADELAGSGAQEWIDAPDTLVRQAEDVLASDAFNGIVYYHGDALHALPDNIRQALCKSGTHEKNDLS